MNARKLLTLVVAATVLVGGLAAAGAAMPADAQANDNTPEDPDDNAADDADDAGENASESAESDAADDAAQADGDDAASEAADGNASAAADNQGPPSDLPGQVPDHVSSIHETINSYLDGDVDHLGNALSDLLGDDAESGDAEDADSEDADSEDADSEDPESEDADSEDTENDNTTETENASDVAPIA